MTRRIVGVCVGLIVGSFVVALVEGLSAVVYPMPADVNPDDIGALRRHIQSLPHGAFLFVLAAHAIGTFAASFTCTAIVRGRWVRGSVIIGTIFLITGVVDLVMLPHPIWFAIADVLIYIPCSLLGGSCHRTVDVSDSLDRPYQS